MPHTRAIEPVQPGRLAALRARHADLEEQILEEQKHPAAREHMVKKMKLKKLRLKEAIEQERQRRRAS